MLASIIYALLPTLALAAPADCAARAAPPAQDVFTSTKVARPSPSASSAPNATTGNTPTGDCKCGYVLSSFGDAYYDTVSVLSFETFPDGPLESASALSKFGWEINGSWKMGGAGPDGTVSTGSVDTLSVQDGVLLMTVPGGQKKGGTVKGSEINFAQALTGGVFIMDAQLDATPGTCQSIFTYNDGETGGDEQDIELLGTTMLQKGANGTPEGIQLTNWDPNGTPGDGHKNDNLIVPFPSDPTTGFHTYTIAWLSDKTSYEYDGQALKSPTMYSSVNPSNVILNHWTNGDPNFTAGPPTSDVVMKVKSVTIYYQKGKGMASGCTKETACRV